MTAQISAAEAVVLLNPNQRNSGQALRHFLIELAARGAITVRREGWRKKSFVTFSVGGASALPPARFSADVWRSLGGEQYAGREVPAKTVVDAALMAYGSDRFRENIVLPALVASRLVTTEKRKLLGIIPTTRYAHTAAGSELAAHLERKLSEFASLRWKPPPDAGALRSLVDALGSAVLLAPALRAHHEDIARAFSGRGDGADSGFVYVPSDAAIGGDFDFGAFDDFDLGGLVDAFGAFDFGDSGDGGDGDEGWRWRRLTGLATALRPRPRRAVPPRSARPRP